MRMLYYATLLLLVSSSTFSSGLVAQTQNNEKEAQKHYRVAVEALKNGDLNTAEDELKTASSLVANNALIWYDLAVVEFKKNNPGAAKDCLKKALSLGLPASQQADADELEAKLSYAVRKKLVTDKLLELKGKVDAAHEECNPNVYPTHKYTFKLTRVESCIVDFEYSSAHLNVFPTNDFIAVQSSSIAQIDLSDLSTDVTIREESLPCRTPAPLFVVFAPTTDGKSVHGRWHQLVHSNSGSDKVSDGEVDDKWFRFGFPSEDLAREAARVLGEAVQLCSGKK